MDTIGNSAFAANFQKLRTVLFAAPTRTPKLRTLAALAAMVLAPGFVTTTGAQEVYFRMYSQWLGTNMPLDVINGGATNNFVTVAPEADVSGQQWAQSIDGDSIRMTTQYLGKEMCLDVANGGELDKFLVMQPCGNFSGQLWYFRESPAGYWLQALNRFTGDTMCLSIISGGDHDRMVQMEECGNFTGQMWQYN